MHNIIDITPHNINKHYQTCINALSKPTITDYDKHLILSAYESIKRIRQSTDDTIY